MKIEDAIKDYINYCVFEKGLSDKTKESYMNDLGVYSEYLKEKGITTINRISDSHIKSFLKDKNDNATSTIAHNLILTLRRVCGRVRNLYFFLHFFGTILCT